MFLVFLGGPQPSKSGARTDRCWLSELQLQPCTPVGLQLQLISNLSDFARTLIDLVHFQFLNSKLMLGTLLVLHNLPKINRIAPKGSGSFFDVILFWVSVAF